HDRELPGLEIEFSDDPGLLHKILEAKSPSPRDKVAPGRQSFAGLLQQGKTLSIISIRAMPEPRGVRVVTLRVPLTEDFLASIAPDLGAIQLNLMQRYSGRGHQGVLYTTTDGVQYENTHRIVARNRFLQPAMLWIATPVNGVSRLDSTYVGADGVVEPVRPVLAVFNARPSQLSGRMFRSLG